MDTTATTAVNPFDASATAYGQAQNTVSGMPQGGLLPNINSYIDPYYDQVINQALGRMDEQKQQTLGNIGDQATAAGAFGGSRHGIMEGTYLGEYNKNVGDMVAQGQSNAWNNAVNNYGTDVSTSLAKAGGEAALGGTMFGVGSQLNQDQYNAGSQQQVLMQQILSGGANAFDSMMQHPYQIMDLLNGIVTGDPRNNAGQASSETTSTPGTFDYLGMGLQSAGGKK